MMEFPFRVPICTYEIEDWEEKKKSIQLPDLADKHLDQGVEVILTFLNGIMQVYCHHMLTKFLRQQQSL